MTASSARLSNKLLPMGLLALAFTLFSQQKTENALLIAWQSEEYSHGFLIPIVALLLIFNRLADKKPSIRPSWSGILVLFLAVCFQLVGTLSAFDMAGQLGLILAFTGISLSFLGCSATWEIAPAIAYLIFAVPLPHLVQTLLSQKLQLISSTIGVDILELFGIPVFQEGNIIDLGKFQLQIVEACSGLRYLFPLMSFGYLVAFLLSDSRWKRIVIFLSTIPITIAFNSLRIAFIGITVDIWGQKMAEGFIHGFEGWTVFLICVVILMIEVWILSHIGKKGRFRYEYFSIPHGPFFSGATGSNGSAATALIICALCAFLFGTGIIEQRAEITPAHPPFSSFPLSLGDWHGKSEALDTETLNFLQLSDYLLNNYIEKDTDKPVNLYIAYYANQRANSTIHSPSNCIPGGGWQIDKSEIVTIKTPAGDNLDLTRLVIRKGDTAEIVYYWLEERGRNLTENYSSKWYLFWDSLFMHRTDGALVRLMTPVMRGETEDMAASRLNSFVAAVLPQIKAYIPGAPDR